MITYEELKRDITVERAPITFRVSPFCFLKLSRIQRSATTRRGNKRKALSKSFSINQASRAASTSGCSPCLLESNISAAFCHSDFSSARPIAWVGMEAVPKRCMPWNRFIRKILQKNTEDKLTIVINEAFMFYCIHSFIQDLHRCNLDIPGQYKFYWGNKGGKIEFTLEL